MIYSLNWFSRREERFIVFWRVLFLTRWLLFVCYFSVKIAVVHRLTSCYFLHQELSGGLRRALFLCHRRLVLWSFGVFTAQTDPWVCTSIFEVLQLRQVNPTIFFPFFTYIYFTWRATGRYFAASDEESTIFALTTDPSNEMLITGDSNGTISVWDISSYCISRAEAIVAQVGWSFFQRRDVLLMKICKVTGFSNHFRLY